jgi:hypothetical protein
LRGIKAGADKLDDAAELQVVANDLREELRMGFGIIGARCEIGNGHAGLVYAEASTARKPGLRRSPSRHKQPTKQQNANRNRS